MKLDLLFSYNNSFKEIYSSIITLYNTFFIKLLEYSLEYEKY